MLPVGPLEKGISFAFRGCKADTNIQQPTKTETPPQIYIKIQKPTDKAESLKFIRSQRGAPLLVYDGFIYRCERMTPCRSYWLCIGYKRHKCNGRIICQGNEVVKCTFHIHNQEWQRVQKSVIEYKNLDGVDRDEFLRGSKYHWCNRCHI